MAQRAARKPDATADLYRWRRTRWRGPALGGHLQRACRFAFSAHSGGELTTGQIAEWCRPEVVYGGSKPRDWQIWGKARGRRAVGARRGWGGGRGGVGGFGEQRGGVFW